jgi:hypothetical protein
VSGLRNSAGEGAVAKAPVAADRKSELVRVHLMASSGEPKASNLIKSPHSLVLECTPGHTSRPDLCRQDSGAGRGEAEAGRLPNGLAFGTP